VQPSRLSKSNLTTTCVVQATQKTWRAILERFREHQTPSGRLYGDNSIATIEKKSVVAFLKGRTANAQKNSLKPIKGFIRFAIAEGELTRDPTEDIEIHKDGAKSAGHMTWLEPQIAQYRERYQLGTVARLALELHRGSRTGTCG
jgi:hypothetical protein